MLAPPVGGALFKRWGYRAPFIFTILFTVLDLPARLLVKERVQDVQVVDPASQAEKEKDDALRSTAEVQTQEVLDSEAAVTLMADLSTTTAAIPVPKERMQLSFPQVIYKLLTSVRTMVVLFCTFCPT